MLLSLAFAYGLTMDKQWNTIAHVTTRPMAFPTEAATMTRTITVQVAIPENRQADFYRWFASWLEGVDPTKRNGEIRSEQSPTTSASLRRGERWRTGNRDDRLRDAACLYTEISNNARQILDYWLDREAPWHRAEDMIRELGLKSTRALAGSTNSFAFSEKKCGARGLPFQWKERGDGTIYGMDPETRELFILAREHSGLKMPHRGTRTLTKEK
jgi:hypothetical protein